MHCTKKIHDDLYYIGCDEHRLELFENIHPISEGVSYNSYVLLDDKTVLFDTVDWAVCRQFLENLEYVLAGKDLDYLVINHIEPDHGACIEEIILRYQNVKIISTEKAFEIMRQFKFNIENQEQIIVKDGSQISFGKNEFIFVTAPMVHWPEAMVSYNKTTQTLFSADAFGTFNALNGRVFGEEYDFENEVLPEARRYFTNIVGKYGLQVQTLIRKLSWCEVSMICPLHGPIWRENANLILNKTNQWSKYEPEEKGVLIVFASMYGNTENACTILANKLNDKNIKVKMSNVSNTHVSHLIADSFKYSHIIVASPTYNSDMYPLIHDYLSHAKHLNLSNRSFGIIENGSWNLKAKNAIVKIVDKMKNCEILEPCVQIISSVSENNINQIDYLVQIINEQM